MNVPQISKANPRLRTSSDSVWPLRGPDGRTFAERKADNEKGDNPR